LTRAYHRYTNTNGMRLTREESKQRTRAAVLAAAREVFARDGFHGATLERVAEEAGFTKGAVYSAFDSKADLFLAVYEARVAERIARVDMAVADWQRIMRAERSWTAALTEFWVHASRDPQLRDRFAAAHRAWRRALGEMIAAAAAADGRTLPLPAEKAAVAVMALGNGLALELMLGEDHSDLLDRLAEVLR
jgi:AcrR family transcriptional regulator